MGVSTRVPVAPLWAIVLVAMTGVSGLARADTRSVAVVGVRGHDGVPEPARKAIEDVLVAQVPQAATVRGFTLVPLTKVAAVPAQAAKCERARCRREIGTRLGVTHLLSGRIEVLRDPAAAATRDAGPGTTPSSSNDTVSGTVKPADLKSDQMIDISVPRPERLTLGTPLPEKRVGRGYRVSLWLEDVARGELLFATTIEGDVPFLVGQVRAAVDRLLETASPRDVVARERLRRTAESYEQAKRTRDAVRTYKRAIALEPFHPDAARLGLEVVRVFDRAGATSDADGAIAEWLETYGARSAWAMAGIGGDDAQQAIASEAVKLLLDRATLAHRAADDLRAAQKEGAAPAPPESQAELATKVSVARASYTTLLEHYPTDAAAPTAAHYLGELLFDDGRFDDAARAFVTAAASPGEHQKDAAHGAVYALENEVKAASADGRIAPFDPEKPIRVPPREAKLPSLLERYVAAIDVAAALDPDYEFTPSFVLRAAQVEATYGHRAKAKARLDELLTRWPKGKVAAIAKDLRARL